MAEANKVIDVKKATPDDIAAGLALLAKKKEREEKIKRGEIKFYAKKWKDMSPEQKSKALAQSRRHSARQRILISKAKKAGITVTEAEIDAELKANPVVKK